MAIVPEVASQGSEVITVEATDRDLGLHMEITYAVNNTNVPFEIADPTVSTAATINRCIVGSLYIHNGVLARLNVIPVLVGWSYHGVWWS